MKTFIIYMLLIVSSITATAQGLVKGKVLDKNTDEPLSFVTISITPQGKTTFLKGTTTDIDGNFSVNGLSNGKYTLTVSFVGYKKTTRNFEISNQNKSVSYPFIHLAEDLKTLKEVTVTGQKSAMRLEVDRKSFDVSQMINSQGLSASEVLENVPSVEVDNDGNISLRGNESVEVWINGKASGLTSDNRAQILQQLPAESIDHIEVIDNPSAKFSAEGSAGIINIVLKKDRKAGYYGSLQAGADTRAGANTSFNINYNSSLVDAYFNIGYRHHVNEGRLESEQTYLNTIPNRYQNFSTRNSRMGNNLFSRAGLTLHASSKDDISLSGMFMKGLFKNWSNTPYYNGFVGASMDSYIQTRASRSRGNMNMYYGELGYRHNFSDQNFIDFSVGYHNWKMDNEEYYQDSTHYYLEDKESEYAYQSRPQHNNNKTWEVKLDYENQISKNFKLQAGYQGRFSRENSPQESYADSTSWEGKNLKEDYAYYNRFIYDMDLHALYATGSLNLGKVGVMAGLRGEYWTVNTESYTYAQEHDASKRDKPFKKDYFQLFPSLFVSYQVTPNDQLQLNYTRRLRRPWGGQLNSFKNTRDASIISFGNPLLTPEFSNSFSFNYLRTWTEHSLLVSAYYRPTTDVMQRINYQSSVDHLMYQTSFNLAKSQSTGMEATIKNKFFRILDLTTNINAYYYKLDGFNFDIDGQTVRGEGSHSFSWNARMMAGLILPYDISIQTSGRYRSRRTTAQGYRKGNFSMDFGVKKNFFNKLITVSVNCRDLLNSRKFETYSSTEDFTRYQLNRRGGRKFNLNVTWNFGNGKPKKRPDMQNREDEGGNDNNGMEQSQMGGGDD